MNLTLILPAYDRSIIGTLCGILLDPRLHGDDK